MDIYFVISVRKKDQCFKSYMNNSILWFLIGLLFGITNTFSGGGMGFLTPTVVAAMTQEMTFAAWRSVFLLAAAIYFVGNLAYVFLISGEVQEWNYPKQRREEEGKDCKTEIL